MRKTEPTLRDGLPDPPQPDLLIGLRQYVLDREWETVRDRALQVWGVFGAADLDRAQSDWDELVALIRWRTGEAVPVVEAKLDHIWMEMTVSDDH
jgi:hypothetical protein